MNHTLIEIWAGMTTVGMGYFVYRSEIYRMRLHDAEKSLAQYREERKGWIQRSKEREESLSSLIQKVAKGCAEQEGKQHDELADQI